MRSKRYVCRWWRRVLCLALLTTSISHPSHSSSLNSSVSPEVLPRQTAARFCQLLINDNGQIYPLSYQACRMLTPNDSLTVEQLFTSFVFQDDNWQTLRLFPHLADDGTVSWYAPADELPASLGTEHQKYIREVLPRLQREMMAGNWPVVDDCIDKMIRYQCKYGGKSLQATASPTLFLFLSILLLALFCLPVLGHGAKQSGVIAFSSE